MGYIPLPLTFDVPTSHTFDLGSLKVTFVKRGEGQWDVFFNINSNKFLISLKTRGESIEEFEIIG